MSEHESDRIRKLQWGRREAEKAAKAEEAAGDPDVTVGVSEEPIQTSDIGLSIDMLDADRLRHFAQNLPDITHWSSVPFVVSKLQTIATGIEKAVKDIGLLRLSSPEGTRGDRYEAALRSIANSACCGGCQEAALVAKAALSSAPAATPAIDVNDRAIMSSYLDGCYGDVPEPVERILRQFFGSMLKPQASPRVSAATPAPAKCDGEHGGPRCGDPECWNDEFQPHALTVELSRLSAVASGLLQLDDRYKVGRADGILEAVESVERIIERRVSAAERLAQTCAWTEDDDGVWHTDCGEAWQFTTDGPIENRQRYCGYCGKSLSAAPRSVVAPEENK